MIPLNPKIKKRAMIIQKGMILSWIFINANKDEKNA